MCGIAGIVDPGAAPGGRRARLARMLDAQAHRGPDDRGEFHDGPLSLGMVRLAIVDPADGQQPMANASGNVVVVFNGEIFNAPGLRRDLEARGHRFRTDHADTEVLVHLYEEHGDAMLDHLEGMFAFVVLDRRRRRLLAARDPVGTKPLYWSRNGRALAFASELKAFAAADWPMGPVDDEAVSHYLSLQFVPAPWTIRAGVRKLEAGQCLTWDLEREELELERYWALPIEPDQGPSADEWVERLRPALAEAVARWTMSDVPVACSLSGGLDSSAVVALLAESGQPLRTYSLGFEGEGADHVDELARARLVAERFGSEHHELVLGAGRLLDDLPRMVATLDEPYAGGLPSWYVFEFIARDCKVAMTGTGGDELFGNYGKWNGYTRRLGRGPARYPLALYADKRTERTRRRAAPHGHAYHRYLSDAAKQRLWRCEKAGVPADTEAWIEARWQQSRAPDPRDAVAAVDMRAQLPDEFLFMTDRFSMAHGVEARVPLLDRRLLELVFRIPGRLRAPQADPKGLLRRAVGPWLPAPLRRAPKRGFVLPLAHWTRGALRPAIEDLLGPAALRAHPRLAPAAWDELIAPHLRGEVDRSAQVWTLFMLELWARDSACA